MIYFKDTQGVVHVLSPFYLEKSINETFLSKANFIKNGLDLMLNEYAETYDAKMVKGYVQMYDTINAGVSLDYSNEELEIMNNKLERLVGGISE